MAQPMRSPFEGFSALDASLSGCGGVARGNAMSQTSLLQRVRAKMVPLNRGRSGSAPATASMHNAGDANQPSWLDMPRHLMEEIFAILLKDGASDRTARKDMFAAVGVCKDWRRIGFEQFFLSRWASPEDIVHPLQLMALNGQAVPENLQRCFVRREETPRHGLGSARYCMYSGAVQDAPRPKFLLAALQTSRREILIFMDRRCEGRPIARLDCSLLQMRYRIAVTPGCALPFVDTLTRPSSLDRRPSLMGISLPRLGSGDKQLPGAGVAQVAQLPPVLAEVHYHMRLKGFMRPRKMRVTLPHPLELAAFDMDKPAAMQRLASVCGTCPLPEDASPTRASRSLKRSVTGAGPTLAGSMLARLRASGVVMAAATSAPATAIDAAADAALEAHRLTPAASLPGDSNGGGGGGGGGSGERLPLGLRNKQPHWNDNLQCHCLNFHGRVKEASVKNFQLVCADAAVAVALSSAAEPPPGGARPTPTRAARSVAMQFGKVEADVYILDYNPTVITGLQAFCVALTNFDCKLLL